MASGVPAGFKSSDELRRAKELDEARKAGLVPAAVDEETGREINPHIPQYMTTAPWYLNSDKPTLKHQRNWRQQGDGDEPGQQGQQWYDRGAKVFQATKYRKGACPNCGSMSHKVQDCLERPRAKGARWTGKHIAADDKVTELTLAGWDSKRDRYNGYDAAEYARVVEQYERAEALRQELKQREQVEALYREQQGGGGAGTSGGAGGGAGTSKAAAAAAADGGEEGGDGDGAGDDAKLLEEENAAFGDVTKRVRTPGGGSTGSVRNLRIREDTAKYLLNLDANSAHYDPKSRSMREDPNPNRPAGEKTFFGDNFVRTSGEYEAWRALNVHASAAFDKGTEVHVQALPSLAEVMYKQFKQRKEGLSAASQQDVRAKYGDAAAALPEQDEERRLLLGGQTEAYVEYDRSGRTVKGSAAAARRSRYEEDVLINNHTAVWGSWWADGAWGYACCKSRTKNSYCTGKAGEAAAAAGAAQMAANLRAKAARAQADAEARAKSTLSNAHLEKGAGAGVWGSDAPADDAELDPEKVQQALKKLEARERKAAAAAAAAGGNDGAAAAAAAGEEEEGGRSKKKRRRRHGKGDGGSGSSSDGSGSESGGEDNGGVTAEEMEAYRLKRGRADDPAATGTGGTAGYDLL